MPETAPSPARRLAAFLGRFDPGIVATAQAVRRRLRARMPGAVEMVYDNYRGLVLGYSPTDRPSDAVVSVMVARDHVSLIFLQGARLPDPHALLRGSGTQVRHMRIAEAAALDSPQVQALLDAALVLAKPFAPGAKRRTVVRAESAKPLPRASRERRPASLT